MRLVREGNVVVMFPEGTRRKKGLLKKHQARARSGAARIALEAGVPLVPAALAGTDRLLTLGPLRIAFGAPIELDDLRATDDLRRSAHDGDRAADGAHHRARGVVVSVLLAVDGDSFAHRAYHALPKSIRLNAVVGFTNMLTRLWQAEQPDAVLVAWDTLSVPTYRHEAFEPYQSGRVFEESILEQLEILPEVVQRFRLPRREGARLRGGRLPRRRGAGVAGRRARGDLRPRRLPARERPRHDPAADARRERARANRPRRGARALRRRARSRCRT